MFSYDFDFWFYFKLVTKVIDYKLVGFIESIKIGTNHKERKKMFSCK